MANSNHVASFVPSGKRRSRRVTSMIAAVATAGVAGASQSAMGQAVIWSPATQSGADTTVLNAGTTVAAYDLANLTITGLNGVNFTGNNSNAQLGTTFNLPNTSLSNNATAFGSNSSSAPFSTLSSNYQKLLTGGDYSGSGTAQTVTIQNLTSGHQYAVQLWVSDNRANPGRYDTLTSTGGNSVNVYSNNTGTIGGIGQSSTGVFVASSASDSFSMSANSSTQFNAIQLRDVTNIGYWNGTAGDTWDSATTNSFSTNLYSSALASSNFSTASAVLGSVTFADSYYNAGSTVTLANDNNVTIDPVNGVSAPTVNVLLANNAVNYNFSGGSLSVNAISLQGTGTTTFSNSVTTNALVGTGGTLNLASGSSVVINGTGTQILGSTLVGTGSLTINSGVLTVAANAGGFSGAITNNGGLNFNYSGTQSISSMISGTGYVGQIGAGTTNLTGSSNTYTGVTDISAGVLNIAQFSNYGVAGSLGARVASQESATGDGIGIHLGAGTVGATLQYTGSTAQSTNRQIRLSAANNTIDASGTGSGTLSFTYSGVNTNLFDTGGARTLTLTGSNTGINLFAISLTDQATTGLTSLVKSGAGTWELTGASTNGGGTNISNGTLIVGSNQALGTGAVTVQNGASLNISSGATDVLFGGLNVSPSGTLTIGSTLDQLTLNPASGTTATVNGNITGSALVNVVKTGTGTQIVTGNVQNSGATNIYAGTLQFASDAAVGGTGASVTLYPGAVFANASAVDQAFLGRIANPTTYGVIGMAASSSNNLDFSSATGANLSNASLGSYGGSYTYSGTLTPNGTTYRLGGGGGTLVFAGALTGLSNTLQINPNAASSTTVSVTNTSNTLGGLVTINAGTLKLDYTGTNTGATILNSNPLNMSGGTLNITGTATAGQNTSQAFASLTTTTGANSVVVSSPGSGFSNLSLGAITHLQGSTLDFTVPSSGAVSTTTSALVNGITGGWATVGGTNWAQVSGGSVSAFGGYTTSASAGTTPASYLNANIDVTASEIPTAAINPSSLRFNTAGAITLNVSNGTNNNISSGGILVTSNVGNNLSTITGGTITSAFNASTGSAHQYELLLIDNDPSNQLTIASKILNFNTGTATYATGITKSGPGTVVLTGSNSGRTGNNFINGGILNLTTGATSGVNSAGSGSWTINNGGTLVISQNVFQAGNGGITVNSGGTLTVNTSTLFNSYNAYQTLYLNGGTVNGSSGFNWQGTGSANWIQGLANSYSTLSDTNYINSAGYGLNVQLNNGAVINDTAGFQGNGLYVQLVNSATTGTLIMSGQSTMNAIELASGTVQVNSVETFNSSGGLVSGPLGTNTSAGAVLLAGGTLQYSPVNNFDYSSRFSTASGQKYNIDTNGQNVTFATGLTSSTGQLNKLGTGTLTLNAPATYSGATTVSAGTLALGASGTIANTSAVSIAAGATFDISQATTPFALSSSTATLGGSGSVNGSYNHTIGILSPGGTGTVGTLTFNNGLSLQGGSVYLDLNGSNMAMGGTTNDLITVIGNLNLASPTVMTAIFSGGAPASGSYDVINFTGSLIGSTTNLIPPSRTLSVSNTSNSIILTASGGGAANLNWNSSSSTNWDVASSANWLNTGTGHQDIFYQSDNVNFTDGNGGNDGTGSGLQTNINLTTALTPGSVTVSANSTNYTFGGSGSIGGTAGLTMSGSSTLTINTSNIYSGSTNAANGTIIVTATQGLGTGALTIGPSGNVTVGNGGTIGSLNNSSYLVNGSLTYNLGAATALSNGFNGSGTINFTGGAHYNLNGTSSSFNGSTNILSGNASPGNASAFGTGTVNASGGFIYAVNGLTIANPLILATSGTSIEVGGARNNTFSGPVTIANNTSLSLDGGASITFSGNVSGNGYSVSTSTPNGTQYLYIGGNWNLGSGSLNSYIGINLNPPTAGPAITLWSTVNGSGSIAQQTGTTVLAGSNSFGSVYVQGGVLQVSTIADSGPSNLGGSGAALHLQGGTLELTSGNSTTSRAVLIGGGSVTTPTIQVDSGASLTLSGNISNASGGGIEALNFTGAGTVTLSGNNTYSGGINVAAGTLVLASANAFPSGVSNGGTGLTVGSGATVQIANHGGGTTVVPFVSSLTNNGTIDITNNALVLKGAGASIGTISNQVAAAYNNGAWNGAGGSIGAINSSVAAADSTHLTAVGVATGLTSFEGGTVSASDVLLKYTYYGDANLDGQVDGTDYSRIDNGVLMGLTGWYNGDFNYDGVINGSDYTLIDNAFNAQGANIQAQFASPTAQIAGGSGISAVPEPTTLGLLGIGAVGLLGRRRRR